MTGHYRILATLAVHAHIPPSEARHLPMGLITEILDLINTD